ncbi:hypothetical protein KR018_009405 [Drosophila ironensis]|nr:hypothetical protein KR018_009405 [Drosophila ironensis]
MTNLLQLEDELIANLRHYAEDLQLKVDTLRNFHKEWQSRHNQVGADATSYVANPLVSFPLVRRMHMDIPKWYQYARQEIRHNKFIYIFTEQLVEKDLSHIDSIELRTAAVGFLRFQDIYNLDEEEVANGKLYGKQYSSRLSAADCFALGTHLENLQKGRKACKWFNISLEHYEDSLDPVYRILQSSRSKIWEKLGLTLLSMHDHRASERAFKKSLEFASGDDDTEMSHHLASNLAHMFAHVKNCRGQNPPPRKSHLVCRYFTEGSAFLRLAPFKLEQLNLEPFVGVFHDVISDKDRERLIGLRQGQAQGSIKEAKEGLSASRTVELLDRRIQDMTDLELGDSQPLVVSNYGLRGQHYIHLDCEQPKDFVEPFSKSYLWATVLFYLSDIQMGGYASFPDLGFGFKPPTGSALVWHNVDAAGNCDVRSLQATCPALLGTQWVATKWISGSGQWRRKPCRK